MQVLLVQPVQGTGGGLGDAVVQWWWCEKLAWVGGKLPVAGKKARWGIGFGKGGWGPRGIKDNLEDPKGPMDCPPWGLPPFSQRSCGLEVGWCGIQWLKQGGDSASRVFLQLSASQALTNVSGDGESYGHLADC